MAIKVPAGFEARPYQKPLFNCLFNGKKRGIAVWHRRAGKDKVFMAMLASAAMQKVGIYFYILPYYKQARKVVWEGMDSRGVRNLAVFPDEVIKHKNNQEMVLTLINDSIIYFLGSDNIDSIVGTNPIGVFFSEYSLHKPQAWDFLRPILMENGGFAFFNGTPRGKNHMYKMLKAAQTNEDEWFAQVLNVDDTNCITKEQVQHEIEVEGMDEATAKQEFYCSFDAALTGAYYDQQMQDANADQRLIDFPTDPYIPVDVAWDLGIADTMVLILRQKIGQENRIIDVIHNSNEGLPWYVKQLQNKPYVYGYHFLPHDIKARELSSGKSRLNTLYELGLKNLIVVPKNSIEDGINEVRKLLGKTYIHKTRCDLLIEALKTYRKEWDAEKQIFSKQPVHDWSSHFADSLRILAMGDRHHVDAASLPDTAIGTGYDPIHRMDESYPYQQTQADKQALKRMSAPIRSRVAEEYIQPFGALPGWNPLDHLTADGYYN